MLVRVTRGPAELPEVTPALGFLRPTITMVHYFNVKIYIVKV